jgi:hypothetical protein
MDESPKLSPLLSYPKPLEKLTSKPCTDQLTRRYIEERFEMKASLSLWLGHFELKTEKLIGTKAAIAHLT